jgi:hypothetical protein
MWSFLWGLYHLQEDSTYPGDKLDHSSENKQLVYTTKQDSFALFILPFGCHFQKGDDCYQPPSQLTRFYQIKPL